MHKQLHKQSGVVLVVGLVLLLVVSIIGIASMQGTSLEERMAGNNEMRNEAFQGAERTLRDAEQYIRRFKREDMPFPDDFELIQLEDVADDVPSFECSLSSLGKKIRKGEPPASSNFEGDTSLPNRAWVIEWRPISPESEDSPLAGDLAGFPSTSNPANCAPIHELNKLGEAAGTYYVTFAEAQSRDNLATVITQSGYRYRTRWEL